MAQSLGRKPETASVFLQCLHCVDLKPLQTQFTTAGQVCVHQLPYTLKDPCLQQHDWLKLKIQSEKPRSPRFGLVCHQTQSSDYSSKVWVVRLGCTQPAFLSIVEPAPLVSYRQTAHTGSLTLQMRYHNTQNLVLELQKQKFLWRDAMG